MKVLQLSYKIPFPQYDGGSYSVYQSTLQMLEAGMQVKTLAMNPARDYVETKGIFEKYQHDTSFEAVKVDTSIRFLPAFLNLFSGRSYFVSRFYSKVFEEKVVEILSKEKHELVVLEHLYLCLYIPAIRKNTKAKIVLRAQNIEHRLWENYGKGIKNPFKKTLLRLATDRLGKFEKHAAARVDGIVALTAEDAQYFESVSKKPVAEIPVGLLHQPELASGTDNDLPVLFHLGSMDWLPNCQGIDWFLEKVLPLIKKEFPGVKICLAGKKMPGKYLRLNTAGLRVEGTVASSVGYMRDKDILIVPLLSGGGMRVKIIEAMACGKTVISTSVGASGIRCRDGREILIGDTEKTFADQVMRCLRSREWMEHIGQNAFRLVNEQYHTGVLSQKTRNFFSGLLKNETALVLEIPEAG
jgi:glycosyltransferase involved in cell wall biosynthesis